MNELTLVHGIVFFAAALQAITGFGFAVMATPLMLLVLNSANCIQISIFLSLFMSAIMLPTVWREVDWRFLRRLIAGSLLGAPLGLGLYLYLSLATIKLLVAIVLLGVVLTAVLGKKSKPLNSKKDGRYACFTEMLVGFFAGILTASIGMPGVPLALYFAKSDTAKEQVRGTALIFYVGIYAISIVFQGVAGTIDGQSIKSSLLLIPATMAGTFVGNRLFAKINQKYFRILIHCIMGYTGLHILWNAKF